MQLDRLKSIPPKSKIEGIPIKKVAAKYGVARTTVIRWRKHYGLTKSPTGELKTAITAMIESGATVREAMQKTGCSKSYYWDIYRTMKGRTLEERDTEEPFIPFEQRKKMNIDHMKEALGVNDDQLKVWMAGKVWTPDLGFVEVKP